MLRRVQEVGIAERDVLGSGGDELLDVGEDRGLVGHAHPAVVDHRNRAVPAAVGAPAARFDRTDDAHLVADRQAHVTVECGEERPRRAAPGAGFGAGVPELYGNADGFALDPGHERVFVLAGDDGVGDVVAHRGVEAVATDGFGDRRGQLTCEPGGRVHRYRERDAIGPVDQRRIPRIERRVERAHLVAAITEPTGRPREISRLMTEFVGCDEEDAHDVPRVLLW